MTLHNLLNRHAPDLKASGWENGRFVTDCLICAREMVKPPDGTWRLSTSLELAEKDLEAESAEAAIDPRDSPE